MCGGRAGLAFPSHDNMMEAVEAIALYAWRLRGSASRGSDKVMEAAEARGDPGYYITY